jgi:hypothetical protein
LPSLVAFPCHPGISHLSSSPVACRVSPPIACLVALTMQ